MKSKTKLFLMLAIYLVFFIIMMSFRSQWKLYQEVPSNKEWKQAYKIVKQHAKQQDFILFEPSWLAGYALDRSRFKGYSIIDFEDIENTWYSEVEFVWLISLQQATQTKWKLERLDFKKVESHMTKGLLLEKYLSPKMKARYSFKDNLMNASVYIKREHEKERAVKKKDYWAFEGNNEKWNTVSIQNELFRGKQRNCIRFKPGKKEIRGIEYSQVPAGVNLEIYGGITDTGQLTPPGAPVELSIYMNDQLLEIFEYRDIETQFYRSVNISEFINENNEFRFEVQSQNSKKRHFCFDAWIR